MNQSRGYPDLDESTAPDAVRPMLAATRAQFGFLPSAMARMAAAPILATAFHRGLAEFERTSFSPLEREVIVLALVRLIGCEVCVAIHAGILGGMGCDAIAQQILDGQPVDDPRLQVLARFTRAMYETRGDVAPETFASFLGAGFTRAQALEMLVGVGAYVMSTFSNRLTQAGVDLQLMQSGGESAADSAAGG
jgi:AhpD family alkylhydroperoxidase